MIKEGVKVHNLKRIFLDYEPKKCLGILHWYMGSTAKRMFEDEKAAVLQQIETECNKYAGESLPIPSRGNKARYNRSGLYLLKLGIVSARTLYVMYGY